MKKIAFLISLSILLSGCSTDFLGKIGNGRSSKHTINADSFSSISAPSAIDVYYSQSQDGQSITLTCDENLADYYRVGVTDGTLVVDTKPAIILQAKTDTYVSATSPLLTEVKLSGSGNVFVESPVFVEGTFSAKTSGSGNADIAGVTSYTAEFKTSGSGNIYADAVTAEDIFITTTGSGNCTIVCKDAGDIEIKISGSGNVTLSGNARRIVDISNSGSGKVDFRNLALSTK